MQHIDMLLMPTAGVSPPKASEKANILTAEAEDIAIKARFGGRTVWCSRGWLPFGCWLS